MTAREYARIESAAAELRSQAETMTNDRDLGGLETLKQFKPLE